MGAPWRRLSGDTGDGARGRGHADQGAVIAEFAVRVAGGDVVPEAAGPPEWVQLGGALGGGGVAGAAGGCGCGVGGAAAGETAGEGGGDGVGVVAGAEGALDCGEGAAEAMVGGGRSGMSVAVAVRSWAEVGDGCRRDDLEVGRLGRFAGVFEGGFQEVSGFGVMHEGWNVWSREREAGVGGYDGRVLDGLGISSWELLDDED